VKLTVRDILSLRPCWTEDEVQHGFAGRRSMLPSEIVFGLFADQDRRMYASQDDARWLTREIAARIEADSAATDVYWDAQTSSNSYEEALSKRWNATLAAALWLDDQPHWRKWRR
jgi:hypothetical protein